MGRSFFYFERTDEYVNPYYMMAKKSGLATLVTAAIAAGSLYVGAKTDKESLDMVCAAVASITIASTAALGLVALVQTFRGVAYQKNYHADKK